MRTEMLEEIQIETSAGLCFRAHACGERGAPLVLLLHGFPQTRYAWRHQLPALAAAGFYAVAPDQRGYSPGARPREVAAYLQRHLSDDVLQLADAIGESRFHLVGHDWGGQVAWWVAARAPERLNTLSVLSRPHPAAFADAMRADQRQGHRSRHHRAFLDPSMTDRLLEDDARRLRRSFADQWVSKRDIDAYLAVLGERETLDAALNWYRAAGLGRSDSADPPPSGMASATVPKVVVPTLYLWGDLDATVGAAAAGRTEQYVAGPYRFVPFAGAGHFLTDQRPEEVNQALLAWLTSRGVPTRGRERGRKHG